MVIPPDDTLREEALHLLLSARIAPRGEHLGWEYDYTQASKEELEASTPAVEWEPIRIDENESVFLNMLAIKGTLELSDEPFLKWAGDEQIDVASLVDRLTETRIVALDRFCCPTGLADAIHQFYPRWPSLGSNRRCPF